MTNLFLYQTLYMYDYKRDKFHVIIKKHLQMPMNSLKVLCQIIHCHTLSYSLQLFVEFNLTDVVMSHMESMI